MKNKTFAALALGVVLLSSVAIAADPGQASPDQKSPVWIKNSDPAADRQIIFFEKDGMLDIRLEGYSGMTEAARDFIEHLKKQKICE